MELPAPGPPVLSRCHFCAEPLPAFPEGGVPDAGRTAFDPWQGRLWRICGRCGRWSAAPLDARWEALEACERAARDGGRVRLETANLTLLHVGAAELVRVGRAPRPEFAGWRYGDRLPEQRVRGIMARLVARLTALPDAPPGGVDFHGQPHGHPGAWPASPFVEHAAALDYVFRHVPLAPVCPSCDQPLALAPTAFAELRLLDEGADAALAALCAGCGMEVLLPLPSARAALRLGLAVVNRPLRRLEPAEAAGRRVEAAGGRQAFLHDLAREHVALGELEPTERLGLGLALDEAAEAELLELEWREAEELAVLMDRELSRVEGYEDLLRQAGRET
jgi:hypothetical protein